MQQLCCLLCAITLEKHSRSTYLSNLAVLLEGTNLIGTLPVELFLSTLTKLLICDSLVYLLMQVLNAKVHKRFKILILHLFGIWITLGI